MAETTSSGSSSRLSIFSIAATVKVILFLISKSMTLTRMRSTALTSPVSLAQSEDLFDVEHFSQSLSDYRGAAQSGLARCRRH